MTLLHDAPLRQFADVLRGDRTRRPARDEAVGAGLRAQLEDSVYDLFAAAPRAVVTVSSATIRRPPTRADIGDSTLSRARGAAVTTLFHLLVAQVPVEDPWEAALAAWRAQRPDDELLTRVDHLDPDQTSRLRADVDAHYSTLTRCVGTIPSSWWPRTGQRARQVFGGGAVQLLDVVDLVVGSTQGDVANVALVDVTTSPLGVGAERAMRYHALMQTLRGSVAPLRTSAFSSATGELWTLDVDAELLQRALGEVVDVLATRVNR